MPIYEYFCNKCKLTIEKLQKMGDNFSHCPDCGGIMVKRPTSPAIIKILGRGGYPVRSKGYKEGYSKEYLKDNPPSTKD